MEPRSSDRSSTPLTGLILIGLLGLAGFVALSVSGGRFPAATLRDLYLAASLAIIGIYVAAVFLAGRRTAAENQRMRGSAESMEESLLLLLRQLQAGDLVRVEEQAEGLPTKLSRATAAAAQALGSLVQQIQYSSTEVAASGNSVNETANELASGSSEQAAAVVEITATMEELARTAAQIAANAASQAELAAQAEESGNGGAAAVEEALAGVEEVQKRIDGVASRADNLGTRSRDIYRVLELINEIAQETHILSLNAGIEAAAAGEHGRRFSVVAEEVRRLAQRSRESVESVRALLDEFAASIRATVVATEEGSKETAAVLERARAAASSIEELRGALAETAQAAREISMATEQQRTASDQVVLTLKEVSQVIQRMADGLKNFSGTADRLNHLALAIQLLTQSFRLDSERSLRHLAEGWAEELGHLEGQASALPGEVERIQQDAPFVECSYFVDAAANVVAITVNRDLVGDCDVPSSIAVGANLVDRPWFQTVTREKRAILTQMYSSLLTDQAIFTVAVPVRGSDGGLIGVLGLDVNQRSWTKI